MYFYTLISISLFTTAVITTAGFIMAYEMCPKIFTTNMTASPKFNEAWITSPVDNIKN